MNRPSAILEAQLCNPCDSGVCAGMMDDLSYKSITNEQKMFLRTHVTHDEAPVSQEVYFLDAQESVVSCRDDGGDRQRHQDPVAGGLLRCI